MTDEPRRTKQPRRNRPFPDLSSSDFSSLAEAEAAMREFDEQWGHLAPDEDDDLDYHLDRMYERWADLMAGGDEEGARAIADAIDLQLASTRPWLAHAADRHPASHPRRDTPS